MKLLDPIVFCNTPSAAPALNRGLAALAALGEKGGPLSLDALASLLSVPKASLFRLLETLQDLGLVLKTADRCYEPLWTLQPIEDRRTVHRRRIERNLEGLCETTKCTVEWYEPTESGMALVRQIQPESELRVQAKPGFLREWAGEFDAVARLAHAFASYAPPLVSPKVYVSNGVLKALPKKEASTRLAEARRSRTAEDGIFNSNGVRRCAAAAFDDASGTFMGVLALAEVCHFSNRPPAAEFLPQLLKILNTHNS